MQNNHKQFNQLTLDEIHTYFTQQGYQSGKPMLLSFDGDKTIVDRDRGAHFLSKAVIAMFYTLRDDPRFIVTMNTGRDADNYIPLKEQTGHEEPNIFLAGRVIHHEGKIHTHPIAVFSVNLKRTMWRQFVEGTIPFLDVKDGKGNTFFVSGKRGLEHYYGHHRPAGWFDTLPLHAIDIDTDPEAEKKFMAMEIVRAEIPFLSVNGASDMVQAINTKDRQATKEIAENLLEIDEPLEMLFIPAPTNKTRGEQVRNEIGSIRILVHDKYVNKGVGLERLATMLEIPATNIVYFGDSAEDKANDAIIKTVLPKATLIITDNGEEAAKQFADFIVEPVSEDGVPKAVEKLIDFQKRYSTVGK